MIKHNLKNENYNLKWYQKERTFNTLWDIDIVSYYNWYIDMNSKWEKKVEEQRTYTRDGTTGLLVERTINHLWYENWVQVDSKNTVKKYTAEEWYEANKRAAKNLTRQASMYLISQVWVDNGKAFLDTVVSQLSSYESWSRAWLLSSIQAYDFTTFAWVYATLDATIKATLDVILDVSYA